MSHPLTCPEETGVKSLNPALPGSAPCISESNVLRTEYRVEFANDEDNASTPIPLTHWFRAQVFYKNYTKIMVMSFIFVYHLFLSFL